jgi:cytoskeleton protein RodZ
MTEEAVRSAETTATVASGESAGRLLRQAREAAGVHIAALAVALKVPVAKLEALEADRYEALPDAVFARALASSMCRVLKVDPSAVLERLPQGQPTRLAANSTGLNASFKDSHAKSTVALGAEGGSKKVKWAVIGLLAAAVVVYLLPHDAIESLRTAVSGGGSVATTTPGESAKPMQEPVVAAASQAVEREVATPAVVMAALDTPAVTPNPVATTPVAPASAAASVPPDVKPIAATGDGVLEFRATSESWVQVRDASGAVTFQRSLAAGESAMAPGRPPLSVVVGKVNATQVYVRGAPFDLAAVARENVARFEVK